MPLERRNRSASALWGASGVLAAGIAYEASPLLVFTVANLWILFASYAGWSSTCSSSTTRQAVAARLGRYGAFVIAVALGALVKSVAPTATRTGTSELVLAVGAVLQCGVCLALIYWTQLGSEESR